MKPKLQWGRRFSSAEGRCVYHTIVGRTTGFNGAADFHRRKVHPAIKSRRLYRAASMGPPIFIGGRVPSGFKILTVKFSFNGAADFHRRKELSIEEPLPLRRRLQWGRRFSSAEGWRIVEVAE